MNEKAAISAIKKVTEIFKRHNSKFSLEFGTLLGKVREEGIINGDGDVDLAVDYDDGWNPEVIKEMERNHFVLKKKTPNKITDENLLRFVGKNKLNSVTQYKFVYQLFNKNDEYVGGAKVSFEIYHRGIKNYKDMMYFWPSSKPNWIFQIPRNYMYPYIKTDFYGIEVMIPKNYIDNLNFMYGSNWTTPKPGYHNSEEHMENAKRFRKIYI